FPIAKWQIRRCSTTSLQKFINDLLHGLYCTEYKASKESDAGKRKDSIPQEEVAEIIGACPYRQYLPMKPNPVGIKNFVCATADGIVLDFDLYQGKVHCLSRSKKKSIRGVEQMMKKEMYITGTIMNNRLAGAKEKLPSDKTMKNTGRGTSSELSTEDEKLRVVKWYDNKPVLMMSVVHGTEPEDTCQRWDKTLKQYVTVSRPSIVREYNLKMANSWLLYRKDLAMCAAPKKSIMQFLEFRTEMATTLLAQHHGQGSDADLSE
ncbi:hypothetical protein KUCAC02_007102, partial [Chaenocephalus aceratus]